MLSCVEVIVFDIFSIRLRICIVFLEYRNIYRQYLSKHNACLIFFIFSLTSKVGGIDRIYI